MTSPPPPPSHVPYATPAVASEDDTYLNILAIGHYVIGSLVALFSSFGLIHFGLGLTMVLGRGPLPSGAGETMLVGWMFLLIGGLVVLSGWTVGGLAIYSGRCIARRWRRTFSLVVAGVLCLFVPLGTVLGVFTIIVLVRDPVRRQYGE
ncbi:MAG TPA: hypothetical protein VK324_11275 [Tepidisphaeraceae bacterium]|nr:hypothetical protein [Tepidisphaeraceae bacterium]